MLACRSPVSGGLSQLQVIFTIATAIGWFSKVLSEDQVCTTFSPVVSLRLRLCYCGCCCCPRSCHSGITRIERYPLELGLYISPATMQSFKSEGVIALVTASLEGGTGGAEPPR
jgi:hypothetical protein